MPKAKILVVDDEESSLYIIKLFLKNLGYSVLTAKNGFEALEIIKTQNIDIIISDQIMPEMNGVELLDAVKKIDPNIPFVMLTAHGSVNGAVYAIKQGADDYLQKPFESHELEALIKKSLDYSRLNKQYLELKNYLNSLYSFENIITKSPQMLKALNLAEKVTQSPYTTVAIYGESGSGKEVLARAIHSGSKRMESRFAAVNCACIPATLLESELFGSVKGSFTGSNQDRQGIFDMAQEGTMLLDEIGDMPLELQSKILRVLEERCYQRIGSTKSLKSDFRVIVTTHRNLSDMVQKNQFREDLFHRINIYPIYIPPLRERKEDIPLLVKHFLNIFTKQLNKNLATSKLAMDIILNYSWPGNIRELKNSLERAAILSDKEVIGPEYLNISTLNISNNESNHNVRLEINLPISDFSLDAAVNQILISVLKDCNNNKTKAAKLLKVDRKLFYRHK
ncbi:MAG: sigma-54-dependent Fis family transcriptional regulator [Desulfobacterales bacterium]|nr:sigma-54-dependent Fis family transcriptional regulator [Desulfobacterales bacterium]